MFDLTKMGQHYLFRSPYDFFYKNAVDVIRFKIGNTNSSFEELKAKANLYAIQNGFSYAIAQRDSSRLRLACKSTDCLAILFAL